MEPEESEERKVRRSLRKQDSRRLRRLTRTRPVGGEREKEREKVRRGGRGKEGMKE